ncbi:hypothetical protein NDU88_006375 [Pleurodeles waltl]|uniref:ADF-H domain-containing protein n=1 Tax=Pleurodeles waltl TaxID=8319 RepID=A0AAV7MZ14_PLEWA|nr:hypothetical protein NDU88_006375 [Pleurodeles waltl]
MCDTLALLDIRGAGPDNLEHQGQAILLNSRLIENLCFGAAGHDPMEYQGSRVHGTLGIFYSYKYDHSDGRVSYPLCFIFSSPVGCKPEQQMMYAGSKNRLVQTAELTKVFEIRNTDDLTESWLKEKLSFFR